MPPPSTDADAARCSDFVIDVTEQAMYRSDFANELVAAENFVGSIATFIVDERAIAPRAQDQ
jgi:hypothetical protein